VANIVLPEGWSTRKLGDILELVRNGTTAKQNGERKGYPVTRIETISSGEIDEDRVGFVELDSMTAEKYRLIDGDILFSHINSIEHIGKTAIYKGKPETLIHGMNLLLLRARKDIIQPEFLHFFLKGNFARDSWRVRAKQAVNQASLNQANIAELDIPVPPLETQKDLVEILKKAENLEKLREQANQMSKKVLETVFLKMFGDPILNPEKWDLLKLSQVGTVARGKSKHRPRNAPELLGGKYPLIQTGDVANSGGYITEYRQTYSEIGLKQSKMWQKGTLCITIAANIAATGILTFDTCFPDSVVGFTPSERVTTEYVQYWLSFLQSTLEATAPQVAQKNINLKILANLNIPVPPIKLQNKFSSIVFEVEQVKKKQKQSSQEIEKVSNSLMSKIFKGELAP
jgi:type I restriction enzyme S subunit